MNFDINLIELPPQTGGKRSYAGGLSTALLGVFLVAQALIIPSATAEPWRLSKAMGLPEFLSLSGSFRARYESLSNRYRAGRLGSDQLLSLRTMILAEADFESLKFVFEMQDARQKLADSGSTTNIAIVNTTELIQAYVSWRQQNLFSSELNSELKLGRMTLDIGSRRFVARTRFRNTNNGFTGAHWQLSGENDSSFQAFFVAPVDRFPRAQSALLDNETEFDSEHFETQLWGAYYRWPTFASGDRAEVFLIGLNEDDNRDVQTRNRDLYTVGGRIYRPKKKSAVDYEFETALQFGESRASTSANDRQDLDHFAHFHHAELGYTFDTLWSPQLVLQYDYASGDDSNTDRESDRFDPLFGARRFDFGPTSMYGPFARTNISSPGIRLRFKPSNKIRGFISARGYWLASDTDAWTTARVRDARGNSGSYIGTQLETRLQWDIVPKNVRLETGLAQIIEGEFMRDAPNATRSGDLTYFYMQTLLKF